MQKKVTQTDGRIFKFSDRLVQSGENLGSSDKSVFLQELVE
jgi:hypothetical protein